MANWHPGQQSHIQSIVRNSYCAFRVSLAKAVSAHQDMIVSGDALEHFELCLLTNQHTGLVYMNNPVTLFTHSGRVSFGPQLQSDTIISFGEDRLL